MQNPYKKNFDGRIILCEKKHIAAGKIYEMHWHDYIEMEIILSGVAEHIYNSQVTNVSRGHTYIITSHDFHALHAQSDVVLLNVCFHSHVMEKEVRETLELISNKNIYGILNEESLVKAADMVKRIADEQGQVGPLSNAMSKAVLGQLLIDIMRLSDKQLPQNDNSLAAKALAYVHTHFKEPLSISDVAHTMSVSPNYLGRLFSEYTGVSFNDYLNDLRLKYACNMLRFSGLATKEIAALSGYSSVEYFFYVFKKKMGMTPKEYRTKNAAQKQTTG